MPGLWDRCKQFGRVERPGTEIARTSGLDYDQRQGGFGPVLALVGIPATVIAAARALRQRNLPWPVLLALVTSQFALQTYHSWSRFMIALVVAAAIAIGALLQRGAEFTSPAVTNALVAGCVLGPQPFPLLRLPLGDGTVVSAQVCSGSKDASGGPGPVTRTTSTAAASAKPGKPRWTLSTSTG